MNLFGQLQHYKQRLRKIPKEELTKILFSNKYVTTVTTDECIYFQISFVIPQEVVPGRMTLLVTLFLVLINIFINVTSNSPNTESLTSISGWIMACILFVFGALLQYGCILLYKYINSDCFNDQSKIKAMKGLDLWCLCISFSSFIVFNIVFWNVQYFYW